MLHLNCLEFDADESKIVFAVTEFKNLPTCDKLLLNELSRAVSDSNLYQVCFLFENEEQVAPGIPNVILPAILLYCSKLELVIARSSHNLQTSEDLLYGLLPKEALREALLMNFSEDESAVAEQGAKVAKIVAAVNKKAIQSFESPQMSFPRSHLIAID